MINNIRDMSGRSFSVGDEVQDDRARFFIGAINESCGLCILDKTKPFTRLIKDDDPFSRCIDQGKYAVNYAALSHVQ